MSKEPWETCPNFLCDRLMRCEYSTCVSRPGTPAKSWVWTYPTGAPVDPTAETEPLTMGQQLVADWEMNKFHEPCELAEAIDRAIWEAKNAKR